VEVRSKASGKRAAAVTHLAMGWLVTLSVPMLVLIQSWSLCTVQLTSSQLFLSPTSLMLAAPSCIQAITFVATFHLAPLCVDSQQ